MSERTGGAAQGWMRRGGRVPSVALETASGRGPRILFTSHPADCGPCAEYARRLIDSAARFQEWDARLLLVRPGPVGPAAPGSEASGIVYLADPENEIARGAATVVVADEWGEVYQAWDAADGHELPGVDELVEWLQFVGIQCPECEGAEGPWRTL